ncbi:hypothetical protein [Nocardia asteroides]|uniref:hypothetical protein n=1 Tax=Nocardia asteroides TaxID=1824 RepID=UPI0033E22E36
MPTTRKPAVKRAPRKTTAQKVSAFEGLRRRAGDNSLAVPEYQPITLGADMGFDPPLVVTYPELLSDRVALDVASRRDDTIGFLFQLLGERGFARVLLAFDGQPDGERLLVGLQLYLLDHFLGRGAGDVPGGTPASSTS